MTISHHRANKLRAAVSRQRGQALVEYVVCAVFLTLIVWFALVGRSVSGAKPVAERGVMETEVKAPDPGGYLGNRALPGEVGGLLQVMEQKQVDYRETIFRP